MAMIDSDAGLADEHRRAFEAAINLQLIGDRLTHDSLRGREQILLGNAAAVSQSVENLLAGGYRPPGLILFLRRYCAPARRQALGPSCSIRNLEHARGQS